MLNADDVKHNMVFWGNC